MKKTLIKICGITNREDAETAVTQGADGLGFVLYPKSSRFISYNAAQEICRHIPNKILKIAVVVNADAKVLDALAAEQYFNYFQLHGNESPELCKRYPGLVIKAFRIKQRFNMDLLRRYQASEMFLFDTKTDGQYGGTGAKFDWNTIVSIPRSKPVILAGGLTEDNVADAINLVQPYMVDVSSSVESHPGKKDAQKIEKFISACHAASG